MKISKSLTCFVLTWAKRLFIVFNIIVMDSNEKEQSAGKAEKQEALRLVIFDSDPKEEAKLKRMAASLGCEVVTKYDTESPPTRTVLKDSNSYIYAFAAHCHQKIVHADWLVASFWKNHLLDETPYLMETIYDRHRDLQERYDRLIEKHREDKATQYEEQQPFAEAAVSGEEFIAPN